MRYRCLVLDHDDTSVQSTPTVHYPAYVETMRRLRPQLTPATREEFTRLWFESRFMETCRDVYRFTPEEMQFQDDNWKEFMQQRVPELFDGLPQIIRRLTEKMPQTLIASGLLQDKSDVMAALSAGAIAISTTDEALWFV